MVSGYQLGQCRSRGTEKQQRPGVARPFKHAFIHSLNHLFAPSTALPITGAPPFPGSGHTQASFLTLFSYHPSLPIQTAHSVGSTFKIHLKFYPLTTSTASSFVQAWQCISLPTGLRESSSAPLVFPLAHTASKISKSKMQIRCSPSPALNPVRFPSYSKQKPKSFLKPT